MEEFILSFSLYERISVGILLFMLVIQFIYYFFIFIRVPSFRSNKIVFSKTKEPVSVVICAKNEAENLANHLSSILEQDYPDYEVVVVNDCSDDETQHVLEDFQEKYAHLRVTQIKNDEKFTHGKKLALTIGIKAAKNEWLLLTDADCKPESNQWITAMQRNFTPENQIVLGYGGYLAESGFLNKLVRFDSFFIALQYLSFALIKKPYMGVGRNLAYRKSLFMKNKGFASHAHILSGDDDLFINAVANRENTSVEFSREAHTRSIPKKLFNLWAFQKRRHLSTGMTYKLGDQILLGTEIFSRAFFYITMLMVVINPVTWPVGLSVFLIRMIVQLSVFNGAMNKLNEKKLLLLSIIFDFILPLTNLFFYFTHFLTSKKHRWK